MGIIMKTTSLTSSIFLRYLQHYLEFSHGDELFLIWSPLAFAQWELSDNDMAASLQITTFWSNFIKTGDPGPAWSPVTSDDKRYLNLGLEQHMQERDDYYLERMEFWRSLL